jgi:hypothetical protein
VKNDPADNIVPEDVAIADRINQVTEDYKKYLQ